MVNLGHFRLNVLTFDNTSTERDDIQPQTPVDGALVPEANQEGSNKKHLERKHVTINILYTYTSAFSYMYAPMLTIVYTSLPSTELSPTPSPVPIRFAHLFPNNMQILHIYTAKVAS